MRGLVLHVCPTRRYAYNLFHPRFPDPLVHTHPYRNNQASNCEGAGVRLGGKTIDGYHYGQKNNVRPTVSPPVELNCSVICLVVPAVL